MKSVLRSRSAFGNEDKIEHVRDPCVNPLQYVSHGETTASCAKNKTSLIMSIIGIKLHQAALNTHMGLIRRSPWI